MQKRDWNVIPAKGMSLDTVIATAATNGGGGKFFTFGDCLNLLKRNAELVYEVEQLKAQVEDLEDDGE